MSNRHGNSLKGRLAALLVAVVFLLTPFVALAEALPAACASCCCCCSHATPTDAPAVSDDNGCRCESAPSAPAPAPTVATLAKEPAQRALLDLPLALAAAMPSPESASGFANNAPVDISPHTPVALHARINC